jgi:hypothetical protein
VKGIPTGLQIQSYSGAQNERNPYNHTSEDNIAHMNLDYWLEQVKATTAIAAHLAIPLQTGSIHGYLPTILKD